MTKKSEQNTTQPGGSVNVTPISIPTSRSSTTSSGIVIVQQQPISEQQHFVLPTSNNVSPMIITTPLGREDFFVRAFNNKRISFSNLAVPSMITQQQLPTTTIVQPQTAAAATSTSTTLVAPSVATTPVANSTAVQNKTTKSPGQDRLICSLCNKVYRSSAGLRYHKRKRHRGMRDENLSLYLYLMFR